MLRQMKEKKKAQVIIAEERMKLCDGVELACIQWKYGNQHEDGNLRKYDVIDLLERRYMYLLNIAKKQRIHALRRG